MDIPLAVLDKPLLVVVKCRLYRACKRITFSHSSLSFVLLKNKIDQSFALSQSAYTIKYRDDENEVSDISSDSDLHEAIDYFSQGSDNPSESSSAISFTQHQRIYMHIFVELEYDGPCLSDTVSLRSARDSFRFQSQSSLQYPKPDSDAASYMSGRHAAPIPPYTGRSLSILCGCVAALQVPLLYMSGSDFNNRLVHTLFAWSTLLHLFGAIISATSPSEDSPARWQFDLPHPAVAASSATGLMRVVNVFKERVLYFAQNCALIFSAMGMICLVASILCFLWSAHPLAFHVPTARGVLVVLTLTFFASLGYRLFRTQQES